MNIDSGNLQFNRYQTGNVTGTRPETVVNNDTQVASGNVALAQAEQGQTFTGQIVDVNGSQVTIQMEGNLMLQARMSETVNLNMGDTIAFLVKENSGNTVMIQPLASDLQAMKNQTIFDLLEKNQLSPSDKNYQIAETLLNENMPVDRASMQKVLQQAYKYPDASIQTLVSMNKMQLPVTEQTIAGFEQYQTNQHAMMQALSGMTEEITAYMSEPDGMREMLQVLSDAQDLPVLNADAMLQELEQTTGDFLFVQGRINAGMELQATDMTDNSQVLSAEQLSAFAEKFGMTEEQLTDFTKQLQDMHFDAQTIRTLYTQSDTTMQLVNHLQALVAGASDKSMIDAETMKDFFMSDGMKDLLETAVKEKFTLNPEKMQNPQEVSDLYKGIYEKMDRLMQQMSGHTGSSGEHLSESAKGMQERIDFLQNLSNLFPYAQIPVRMEGRDGNADLFVYMNKKRMQEKKEDVSALLHLDMEYLGPTDVHVSLRGTMVHTKFYVEDEESAKIIDAHMTQLEQAIAENGYSLTNEVIMREPTLHPETEKNAVVKEMFGDDIEKRVKRYSFDVRT
ncbi:flagellar hook-length control protein FliK [Eubacterium sp. MSJ-33]|uniref:flagellar hook-length control protein FliK n=1 Tax=Eubacterium sp. MSJ-33 TaxID=2841528 RepID=UPI001C758A66|nr:flagellar hook-length control protein FliK [Eubacterium sp. MSJ-33]QWT53653.1 flagellar hook-length control protein FliK [Eubacterium sp. MSJ-33]